MALLTFDDGTLIVSCWSGGIDLISPNGQTKTISNALNKPAPSIVADGFAMPVGLVRMPNNKLLVTD